MDHAYGRPRVRLPCVDGQLTIERSAFDLLLEVQFQAGGASLWAFALRVLGTGWFSVLLAERDPESLTLREPVQPARTSHSLAKRTVRANGATSLARAAAAGQSPGCRLSAGLG